MTAASFSDRLYAWRDALIGNPLFQRLSVAFPLTRPIAQKQARALFDVCAGFVYAQVLSACVTLDIFARVRTQPKTAQELAAETALTEERMLRLLRAAVSLRLLSKRSGERFGLGMLGAALAADPGIAAMVRHHAILYRDLADPVALLRGDLKETELARFWRYTATPEGIASSDVADYSTLMATSQSFISRDVLDAYSFSRHRKVMDVGGGEGAFLLAAAARFPHLQLSLFDLPPVAARAAARFAAAGLSDRAQTHGGSFRSDPLPEGADLVTLVRVVHDHDDDVVRALFQRIYAALPAGGTLLIAEPMAEARGAAPVGDAYFGFYLLAMGSGRARTPGELTAMLRAAGFGSVREIKTRRPMLVSAITARK